MWYNKATVFVGLAAAASISILVAYLLIQMCFCHQLRQSYWVSATCVSLRYGSLSKFCRKFPNLS